MSKPSQTQRGRRHEERCTLAAHSAHCSHTSAGSAALLVPLPPPQARSQPPAPAFARKQWQHFVVLHAVGRRTLLTAAAVASLAPA